MAFCRKVAAELNPTCQMSHLSSESFSLLRKENTHLLSQLLAWSRLGVLSLLLVTHWCFVWGLGLSARGGAVGLKITFIELHSKLNCSPARQTFAATDKESVPITPAVVLGPACWWWLSRYQHLGVSPVLSCKCGGRGEGLSFILEPKEKPIPEPLINCNETTFYQPTQIYE